MGSIPHLQTWCNLQCQCGCVFDYLGQDVVEKCFRFAVCQETVKFQFMLAHHVLRFLLGQFNVCKLTWSPFKGSKFPFGRVYLRLVCLAVAMDLDSNERMQKIYAHFEGVQGSTMHWVSYDLAWFSVLKETKNGNLVDFLNESKGFVFLIFVWGPGHIGAEPWQLHLQQVQSGYGFAQAGVCPCGQVDVRWCE